MFRKRSAKGDVQTEYSCSIRFLDDAEPIQLNFKKDTLGQWLFDRVCEKLSLAEKDYFGLRYVDSEKQRHWLDPLKTVYKQLKGVNPMVLCFRVKFYPEEPMKLHEEITRYYLYLQLRRDLHHGRLLCSPQDAVLLAAYIVQSEVGDYDPQDHPPGYITNFKMLPKQNQKMEEQIQKLHLTLKGQVPAEAEGNFLKNASVLDTFGVDPHQVKDQRGDQLYLGVTHQGIMTFRGSRRTQLHKWNQIRRIAYEGKMFIVHVNVAEDEDAANAKKKQQPHGYKCLTVGACKYLWRCAVEQQLFFTLASSFNAPKLKSGGTLFNRGSKFRFSGRCQAEALNYSDGIKRTNSLPNFSRNKHTAETKAGTLNTSLINETVPEDRRQYNEAAVDVPGNAFGEVTTSKIIDSPILTAPLAAEERFEAGNLRTLQASTPMQKTPANGSVPVDTSFLETSIDSVQSYRPNQTVEDEEDEGGPKIPLDEQIKQLEDQYEKIKVNNVASANKGVKNTSAQKVDAGKSSALGKCCRVLTYSVLFAVLMLAVTFVVLFYTKYRHPVLDEGRRQLHFLKPVKIYLDKTAAIIANKFK